MAGKTEYKNNWQAEHKDKKLLLLPKGHKDEVQAAADTVGETLNEFINKAIDERIERIQKDYDSLSDAKKFYRSDEGREAIKNLTQK